MKRKTSNPDQPKLAMIYSALGIGFLFLLSLVWLIGARSVTELEAISDLSRDLLSDYRSRLTIAGKVQEQAANVMAQASLVQVAKSMALPIYPYTSKLKDVRENFNQAIFEAREALSKRTKLQTASPAELAAWREVEEAAKEFLKAMENKVLSGEISDRKNVAENSGEGSDLSSDLPGFKTNSFSQARNRLDDAVAQLIALIDLEQREFLDSIAAKQLQAAAEVSRVRWLAVIVGLFVAVIVFMITRSRILELRQAMKSAKSAQDTARSIFDSQSNDILVMAENGELMAANQAFFNRYHLRPSELLLQDYRGALAHLPEVARFIRDTLQLSSQAEQNSDNANSKNITHRQRIEVKTKRGPRQSQGLPAESRLLDVYVSPLTIERETRGRVVMMVDVTEEEHVREELRRSRTLSAVGQITAQVAHELYNPIGAIKLNIELLEMQVGDGDDDLKQSVARLKRGSEHLSTIVTDLRYLTRPRDPERKPTDMNKLMDEVIELASDRLERARAKVIRQYSSNLQHGNYDPQQLRKVFLNLLINAVEASPQNSQVVLQTGFVPETNGHHAALEVSVVDFGSGMSEETRMRIFEAFYTTKRNGTGLGMMITHEIIKKHNGRIEIESEEGRGTKVSVYLPV